MKLYKYGGAFMKNYREIRNTQEYVFEERCYVVSRSFGKNKTINDLIKELITNRDSQPEPCRWLCIYDIMQLHYIELCHRVP